MEAVSQEYFPHDTYPKSWALFVLLVASIGAALWLTYHPRPTELLPPFSANSAGYDWFLVLHLPEVPQDPAKTTEAQTRYATWLGAMIRAGYHPLLLNDVAKRLQEGVGLPRKTIVLVFDPGYYHTYQTVAPVLQQYRIPAVWLTDRTAQRQGDKHYVNSLQARTMARSGFWDVGYFGEGFWNKHQTSANRELMIDDSLRAQWSSVAGRNALNWSNSFASLNRLDVSPKWSDQDLLDRLQMEVPIQGPVHLGLKRIQERLWGVVLEPEQGEKPFNFKAPLNSNSANIYWLATRGITDTTVDLKVPSYYGTVLLWLRSDTQRGDALGVGFAHEKIVVDQYIRGKRTRLKSVAWSGASRPIAAHLVLTGNALTITAPAIEPLHVQLLPVTASTQGLVRLSIQDRLRGAAQADAVDLLFTPQPPFRTTGPIKQAQ